MDSIFDRMFPETCGSYYFQADAFDRAAIEVEALANTAEQQYWQEIGKDLVPGEIVRTSITPELVMAHIELDTRNVAIYLYAHSLELRLKGLYLQKIGKPPRKHSVREHY